MCQPPLVFALLLSYRVLCNMLEQVAIYNMFVLKYLAVSPGQVVHHLFPAVDPSHYADLAPIIAATCAEFGIPYTCFASWPEAWIRHVRWVAYLNAIDPAAAVPAASTAASARPPRATAAMAAAGEEDRQVVEETK